MTTSINITRSQVFTLAHALKATMNFADALRTAWKVVKLKNKLKAGATTFAFTKKDGSTRKAVGTLNASIIPSDKAPKGTGSRNHKAIAYFDLEKGAWRSFSVASLAAA